MSVVPTDTPINIFPTYDNPKMPSNQPLKKSYNGGGDDVDDVELYVVLLRREQKKISS
jgi:hypothetical protein